jgi:hypothetical protein
MKEWVYATDLLPAAAVVHWLGPDGVAYQRPTDLASNVPDPSTFDGLICFKFTGARWEVIPLTRFDDDQILQGREVKGVKLGTR